MIIIKEKWRQLEGVRKKIYEKLKKYEKKIEKKIYITLRYVNYFFTTRKF